MDINNRVDDHENRIQSLEQYRLEQEKLNSEIRNKLTETEMTVLKESGKQQEMTQKLLDHVLNGKKFSQEQFWKLGFILLGSGGLIYIIVEALTK
ncbi:hypothetical protein MKX78_10820 [Cytobacillus sp. FSL R5-0569]|uniref:hypothetical protein n=1 Tax=Cytobacillus sp. FSL R5-0569 TaxID=2921649 RepID=UPI0030F5260F